MHRLFTSATVRLTAWYLLIIMLISLTFSVILFEISTTALEQGPQHGPGWAMHVDDELLEDLWRQRSRDAEQTLFGLLVALNLATLALGGGASYLLARRTLRPIAEAMESQGRFISDASHELRTPLSVIQTENEVVLRDDRASKTQLRHSLASNLQEVSRLRQLTDRLLSLSSNRPLAMETVTLDQPAVDALNRVLPLAQAKHITIDNTVPPLAVIANQDSLTDALAILLDNAIKYSPERTSIRLGASTQGRRVLISVADQGAGIRQRDIPHIFDRFYRADQSRSKQQVEGYGLGLAIARRIAQQHGGDISVESTLGTGSTFTFSLPLKG